MDLFPAVPEDFAALDDDALLVFIDESEARVAEIRANPDEFVSEERTVDALVGELEAGVEALEAAREELATRSEAEGDGDEADGDGDEGDEPAAEPEAEATVADIEALASRALGESDGGDAGDGDGDGDGDEPEAEPAAEASVEESAVVVAAAPPARKAAPIATLPRPARSRAAAPVAEVRQSVSLTAAAPNLGHDIGEPIAHATDLADMMIKRRGQFGNIPRGTRGEKIPIAQFDWRDRYSEERTLDGNPGSDLEKIYAVLDSDLLVAELERRRDQGLTASGGLCAPVTPYYELAMVSVPDRPVRAALASFNASRGGLKFARPATLADVTTGVGVKTAAEDAAGGTSAEKTCQIVDCPDFDEVDVAIIYHCLQFGNLGARTFPERVAQWNNLVLAAHSRVAESALLTAIGTASTPVTAADIGLGASAAYLTELTVTAEGMRSRHRMADNAVIRALIPAWALGMLVADVVKGQFERFDSAENDFVAWLRANYIEPSFYIDGATGKSQVFGTQSPGALIPYPSTVVSYMYPEGSFLYLDGGTLELGIVRDSVLNATNDFQIFGETFENVAFIGVESIELTSTVCDSGVVALPAEGTCPNYAGIG